VDRIESIFGEGRYVRALGYCHVLRNKSNDSEYSPEKTTDSFPDRLDLAIHGGRNDPRKNMPNTTESVYHFGVRETIVLFGSSTLRTTVLA
jgi:hypothetical protein